MRSLRDPHRKPTHPGAILREGALPELGWTQGELAARLMVSRQTVSDLLPEKNQSPPKWRFVSPERSVVH
jgi:plasmid maintenance system antidote protein VapI